MILDVGFEVWGSAFGVWILFWSSGRARRSFGFWLLGLMIQSQGMQESRVRGIQVCVAPVNLHGAVSSEFGMYSPVAVCGVDVECREVRHLLQG